MTPSALRRVPAGLAKGMSEGLEYGIEHRKAGQDLADIKAYNTEANSKLVKSPPRLEGSEVSDGGSTGEVEGYPDGANHDIFTFRE
ncbi:hypothetical protein Tco_1022004 [Tanacetum coccineum]